MKGYQKYQKANIEKMNPIRLTMMMFQKCLVNMKYIKKNQGNDDTEVLKEIEKCYLNTELILYELQLSLEHNLNSPDDVKEHVKDLETRYNILINKLMKLKRKYDSTINDDLIEAFQVLLDGYREAERGLNDGQ